MPPYIPLRNHSPYSIAEGALFPAETAKRLAGLGIPAAGICDTNSISGAYSVAAAFEKAGLQPLQGTLLDVRHPGTDGEEVSRLVLFARSETGYGQICRLLSAAQTTGRPTPLADLLTEGVVDDCLVLTGGREGPIDKALAAGDVARAERRLDTLARAFGDRLYCELQRQDAPGPADAALIAAAGARDLPLVATSQAWFTDPDMAEAHDALLCIAAGVTLDHDDRPHTDPAGHLKTPDEMAALFADIPDALVNTVHLARRCTFFIEEKTPMLPAFPTRGDLSEADELAAQAREGLERRFAEIGLADNDGPTPHGYHRQDYEARLDHELSVITSMGFPGYFLIVADFIAWAKSRDIPVGPGRGSGAGSIVAWALTITDLDPLRYGLFFERFLNPERVSMPDFDIDFCQARRDEVIEYVRETYGRENVAQIGTLGKLQARAVVRDAARVLQVPFPVMDRFARMIPNNPAAPVSLPEAMETSPLKESLAEADSQVVRAFQIGRQLEGLFRHQSTHAAGVVIADRPAGEIVPTYIDGHGTLVTAFDMKAVEKAGLVKFDFLGLKTLDIIQGTIDIARRAGDTIHLDAHDTEDAETYAMLRSGESFGVFQLEGAGMRKAMLQIQPTCIEDIIALVALYRPGPMENIPHYADIKRGDAVAEYLHPDMEDTLRETHGIIVYQEQVMKLAQDLAGYSLGGADLLRRAMGKKIKAEMDAQRAVFIEGAIGRGLDRQVAEEIFELIARFANYGFNKSHAAAYAVIAYQTAYLRCHHKAAFIAASMNYDIDDVEAVADAVEDASAHGVQVLAPDINASATLFDVETVGGTRAVRFALAALRGVGRGMTDAIVAERAANGAFTSLEDLVSRCRSHLTRRALDALIDSGALDSLAPASKTNRAALAAAVPGLMSEAGARADERKRGQVSMFDMIDLGPTPLPDVPDRDLQERLRRQFQVTGLYLDDHPISPHRTKLARRERLVTIADLAGGAVQGSEVEIAGVVVRSIVKRTARKEPLVILKVSDETGSREIVAFGREADALRAAVPKLDGAALRLLVSASVRDGELSLFMRDVEALDLGLMTPQA